MGVLFLAETAQVAEQAARGRWHTLQGLQMGLISEVDNKQKIEFEDVFR